MADKYLQKARKMARESIYDDAEFLGEWNVYAVYKPSWNDDEPRFIGFPQYILANDKGIRWTSDSEESMAIMQHKF